jgi:hypothetical protein
MRLFSGKRIVLPKPSGDNWWPAPPLEDGWIPYTSPQKYPLGVMLEFGVWECETGTWWSRQIGIANSHSTNTSTMFVATHYWRMTGIGKMQLE